MSELTGQVKALPLGAGRRNLTIVFSDLSDSTALGASMEAEHYAELLGRLRQVWGEVVLKHGGTIVRIQGDGVLAIFGYPQASEDDGRRATEAALDLHDAVRRLQLVPGVGESGLLGLHTGIHAGLVLFDEGDLVRGRFELLGNAPNIAAHLCDIAQRGEILVSEETLGFERQFFQTSERRELRLKGQARSVVAYQILGRAPVHTRFQAQVQRGLTAFVGRRAELQALEFSLRETLAGKARCVAICAAAGVGKTRLIDEFLRSEAAAACQIHRGYCESYLSAEPLQPFLQMLRSIVQIRHGASSADAAQTVDRSLAAIDPGLVAHRAGFLGALSVSDPDAPTGGARRPAPEATIAALRELFAVLASKQPVLLLIDDWQWADDATSQVLNAIRGLESSAVLVVIATRDLAAGDANISGAQIIELDPLTQSEASETIVRLVPQVDPFVVQEIQKYSGGNPLYIEELCHSAAHGEMHRRLGNLHGGAAWLNVMIESRVARLPAAQAELVRTAAVIGNVIPAWLLQSISGYAQDDPVVRGLAEHDFIFPGEVPATLRFKHGITRDVIYDSVGLHQRKAMHLRIAEAIRARGVSGTEEEPFEALAYHFGAAGQAAQAAWYAEAAGDKAMAASALDRAQTQYRAALAALDLLQPSTEMYLRWISIAQKMGFACVFDASRDQLAVFERAVALAHETGELGAIARAHYWLGYFNYALGEARPATHHCLLGLDAARRIADGPLAVQLRATLGQIGAASAEYDRALELLDEAIAIKRRHRTGSHVSIGLGYSLACRAQVLGDRGQFAQAHECFDEALRAIGQSSHQVEASARGLQGVVLLWQGRWEEARQAAAQAARIGEQVRSLYSFSMCRAVEAYASWVLEREIQSLQALRDATAWLEPGGGGLFHSLNHGWLADVLVGDGRPSEARRHAARALVRARKRDLLGGAMAYRALACEASASHDLGRARRYIDLAMDIARLRASAHEVAVTQLCAAGVEFGGGSRDIACRLLDQAERAFETMNMQSHLSRAVRLRGKAPEALHSSGTS